MFLKNVSKEIISIMYDGKSYTVPPGESVDLDIVQPKASIQAQTGLAEKFEAETGRKLMRVAEKPKSAEKGAKAAELEPQASNTGPARGARTAPARTRRGRRA